MTDSFVPYYYSLRSPTSDYPEVFNKYGERMEFFFISDREFAHAPNDTISRYIIWDRYNFGNETHFYTHDEIFHTVGNPKRKFAMMIEPRSILNQSYENLLKHKDYVEKIFDMLFTFDSQTLNTFSNARFVPFAANVWYKITAQDTYRRKTKNISMVSSDKDFCVMHVLRKSLALECKKKSLCDTFGTFDGREFAPVEKYLTDYRYSIVVENSVEPYFFTEKIMNCFAAQTIPIYLGATQIDKFFNADGIIQIGFEDCEHIENILKRCTVEEYERRLPAVMDNFQRTLRAATQTRFDDMYVNYLKGKL